MPGVTSTAADQETALSSTTPTPPSRSPSTELTTQSDSFSQEGVKERFLTKVNKTDGCWEWQGYVRPNGYGTFYAGRMMYAHRYAYEAFVGPIYDDLQVCHRCDNPGCVNPDHLFLGTQEDNLADAKAKGRPIGRPVEPRSECPQGHPYSEDNTYVDPKGWKQCRTCRNQRNLAYYHRSRSRTKST